MVKMNEKQLGKYFAQWAKSEGNFCPSKKAQARVRMMAEYLLKQGEAIINGVDFMCLRAEPANIWMSVDVNDVLGIEKIRVAFRPSQDDQKLLWEGEHRERIQKVLGYKPLSLGKEEFTRFDFLAYIKNLLEISKKFQEFYPMLKKILDGHVVRVKKLDDVTDNILRKVIAKPLPEIPQESKMG